METEIITKKSRADIAEELFRSGANCSQAIVGAFSDLIDVDRDSLMRIASSFGGGLARLREVCGAVLGGAMVLGYLEGFPEEHTYAAKKDHYARVTEFADRYAEKCGSYICGELLGVKRGKSAPEMRSEHYYKKRPCIECIRSAAQILEEMISKESVSK